MAGENNFSTALKQEVLSWPELKELIDQRAEMKLKEKKAEQELTREEIARLWQKSVRSIDRMSDEQIRKNGYVRHHRGVNVRFERITPQQF